MSIYRKTKNSMKQADKEAIKKTLLFQIEEENNNETLLQTGMIWCDGCYTWIDQVTKINTNWLCCDACGTGVVMLT